MAPKPTASNASTSPASTSAEAVDLFATLFEHHESVMLLIDHQSGRIIDANRAAVAFYGWSRATLQSMRITEINQLPLDQVAGAMADARLEHRNYFVFPHRLASGQTRMVEVHSSPIDVGGRPLLFSIIHDVSIREQLEEQLLHAQKMDAIGNLAGSVAHDFNNLLTVIIGHAGLALRGVPRSSDPTDHLDAILDASTRARALTRQLLSLSHKHVLEPVPLAVNDLVAGVHSMLARLIGEQIRLEIDLAPGLQDVEADPSQLEQVVLNLAINARDAMPDGGCLRISTAGVTLGPEQTTGHPEVGPGEYIRLRVADDGTGMDAATQQRVFEPFFTTKAPGRGTGLGLSTVYAIIKQHGGLLELLSRPGWGTQLDVYLPCLRDPRRRPSSAELSAPPPTSQGRILVAEDDPSVRRLVVEILTQAGHEAYAAPDVRSVRELAAERPPDLLVTDVVMPGQSGPALFAALAERQPDLKVLYISGYGDRMLTDQGMQPERLSRLEKPFMAHELLARVDELLNG